MTIPQIPHRDFYVYALFRADGQTPFYIGKGRGNRIGIHERNAHRETSHKDRIIQGMHARGEIVVRAKLMDGLTDMQAKQIEIDLIHLIGRWPIGPLANLTKGGDGVADLAPSSRARKSAANVAAWANPEIREKRLAGMRAVWTAEVRAKYSEQSKRRFTPEYREKISQAAKLRWDGKRKPSPPKKHQPTVIRELWQNEEWRTKVLAKRKERIKNNPIPREIAAVMGGRLNTPEASAKRRATNAIPEVNARRVSAQKTAFSTPEAKANRSEASKKMWAAKKCHQYAVPSLNDAASQPPPKPPGPSSP